MALALPWHVEDAKFIHMAGIYLTPLVRLSHDAIDDSAYWLLIESLQFIGHSPGVEKEKREGLSIKI